MVSAAIPDHQYPARLGGDYSSSSGGEEFYCFRIYSSLGNGDMENAANLDFSRDRG